MFDNFGDYPQDLSSPRSSGIFHQENEELRKARSSAQRFSPISPYFFPQSPALLSPPAAKEDENVTNSIVNTSSENLEQFATGIKALEQAMKQLEKRIKTLEESDETTRRDLASLMQWKSTLYELNPPQGFYRNVSETNQEQQTFNPINFSDSAPASESILESAVEASGILLNSSIMEEVHNNQAMDTEESTPSSQVENEHFNLRLYLREKIMEMKAKQGKKNIQVRSVMKVVRQPLIEILKDQYSEDEVTKLIIEERVELRNYGNSTPCPEKSKKRLCRSPSLEEEELALIASIKKIGHNSKLSHAALAKIIFTEFQKKTEEGDPAFHERSLQQLSYRLSKLRD